MKIRATRKKEECGQSRYPYFGITESDLIVYFIEHETGVVIATGVPHCGNYSTEWDESQFTPFYGTIEVTKQ